MKMGEFREVSVSSSSPSHSPNFNLLRPQNFFHGDFSSSNRFSFNSSSDYSLSSSFSNGFYSSDDNSSSPFASPPFKQQNHTMAYDSLFHKGHEKKTNGVDDDLGLCDDLYRMKIKDDFETLGSIPESDFDFGPSFSPNDQSNNGGFVVSGGFPCGFFRTPKESCDKRNMFSSNNTLQIQDSIANSRQIGWPSYSSTNGGNSPYINGGGQEILGSGLSRGMREYTAYSPQTEISYNHQGYGTTNLPFGSASKGSEPFTSIEESFFMDGTKSLDHQRSGVGNHGNSTEFCHQNLPSVCDIQGYVYLMAKDQHGCRFLQRIFDEGTSVDAMIIFKEVIAHVVELMMDPFGNYLMQKLLDVCTEEQRTQIVLVATSEPGQLIRISLNAYGTRVVQRLVETIRTGKQISLVKSALRPGFLDLIKDLNGNHVIQRCLQCLGTEDNKFIFDAATKYCTEIATHRHGCCVLQKCIAYSMRQQREKLISEISRNSLLLAQDPFGNYAVQFVIELRIPSAVAMMLTQLKGHYVQLSMQKFSSHMVERCLMHCPESRPQIVRELVSVPHFDQLLQDPYANFVIQAALAATKGPLHASLVEVIRPHSILRNNPYCKRIFSRNLLKK
ncbi:hypothetical protein AALP_AA2G224700 [Arabis alpina]|uniref:PUM-HD domain-containing protein n=1 Tax=Arabis alpina TaxID=50452 RepID=A0A087HJ99_ARAAL|nr:hypothetical protein AALP_AA2G224700 [Arabis alpina]